MNEIRLMIRFIHSSSLTLTDSMNADADAPIARCDDARRSAQPASPRHANEGKGASRTIYNSKQI